MTNLGSRWLRSVNAAVGLLSPAPAAVTQPTRDTTNDDSPLIYQLLIYSHSSLQSVSTQYNTILYTLTHLAHTYLAHKGALHCFHSKTACTWMTDWLTDCSYDGSGDRTGNARPCKTVLVRGNEGIKPLCYAANYCSHCQSAATSEVVKCRCSGL